jgi:glutathionyl-hydroquinone reductase
VPGDNVVPDPLHATFTHLRDVYYESDPEYKGRFTVPVLYDKKTRTVVNNESSEIIRMLGTEVLFIPTPQLPLHAANARLVFIGRTVS